MTFSTGDDHEEYPSSCPEDLSEVMDFSCYELPTTIRLIVLSGESRRIDVRRGSRSGAIYVRDGEIFRVETNEGQGDEAFFEILTWNKTIHTDSPISDQPEKNMSVPTNVLLDLLKRKAPHT